MRKTRNKRASQANDGASNMWVEKREIDKKEGQVGKTLELKWRSKRKAGRQASRQEGR